METMVTAPSRSTSTVSVSVMAALPVMFFLGRHSGAMPTGPREARPDDRLRIEPGISRFPDVQLHI
jgi:hypothetical protein